MKYLLQQSEQDYLEGGGAICVSEKRSRGRWRELTFTEILDADKEVKGAWQLIMTLNYLVGSSISICLPVQDSAL